MHTYDISLSISPDMVVWPGDPQVELEEVSQISRGDSCNVTSMKISSHTGTHVDAPKHFIDGGNGVDTLSFKSLIGKAYVVEIPDGVDLITKEVVTRAEIPPRSRRILFKTRNSKLWENGEKIFQKDFVSLSTDCAEYLVQKGIAVVGIDYLSIAPYAQGTEIHQILLKNNIVIIEGLNLSKVKEGRYTLYCFPLKIEGCDGSPARVALIGV
ncbi:MAG: cyclase family protein [Anaerolineales bacterium]|nr:cyclase family protein [Anaerolineales bacterium]